LIGRIERILSESFLIRKRRQDTTLKPRESAGRRENAVQNQDLISLAA
jgi:hypothetical protein